MKWSYDNNEIKQKYIIAIYYYIRKQFIIKSACIKRRNIFNSA